MYNINDCERIALPQGAIYLGPSTEKQSVGYLELNPFTSLTLHNRIGGIENLTQVKGACVMVVFDTANGTNSLLKEGDTLSIVPEGTWHIHANPFDLASLTYWDFDGDIRHVIEGIRKSNG